MKVMLAHSEASVKGSLALGRDLQARPFPEACGRTEPHLVGCTQPTNQLHGSSCLLSRYSVGWRTRIVDVPISPE